MTLPPEQDASLTRKVIRSAFWNALGIWTQKGIAIITGIILARHLAPADYATAGLGTAVLGMVTMVSFYGFTQGLVQRKELREVTCHSLFWFLSLVGISLAALLFLLSPWISSLYDSPPLTTVVRVMSWGLAIGMITSVPNALLQRSMRFKETNILALIGSLISVPVSIWLAFGGYGYWALILPGVAAGLFGTVCCFHLSKYRPKFVFHWAEIVDLSNFGITYISSNVLRYLASNLDYLIMGRFWRKDVFGYYYFAFEKQSQPIQILTMHLSGILLPAFSQLQDDLSRFRRGYLQGVNDLCIVVYPVQILLIGLADPLVPWLFGIQWAPAVPIFQVFFFHTLLVASSSLASDVIFALNRPFLGIIFNGIRLAIVAPLLITMGLSGQGPVITAACLAIVWIALAPLWMTYAHRLMELSWGDFWGHHRPVALAAVAMSVVMLVCSAASRTIHLPLPLHAILCGIIPLSSYLILTRRPLISLYGKVIGALRPR